MADVSQTQPNGPRLTWIDIAVEKRCNLGALPGRIDGIFFAVYQTAVKGIFDKGILVGGMVKSLEVGFVVCEKKVIGPFS